MIHLTEPQHLSAGLSITYRVGSIFDSTAQVLVNPVNCEGVMGKGLAVEFKQRWPAMFREYNQMCRQHRFGAGDFWLHRNRSVPHTLLFATKIYWNRPSRLEWINHGLERFARVVSALQIESIAFPRLGCGNGGLLWSEVRPVMERHLGKLPVSVEIWDLEKVPSA